MIKCTIKDLVKMSPYILQRLMFEAIKLIRVIITSQMGWQYLWLSPQNYPQNTIYQYIANIQQEPKLTTKLP